MQAATISRAETGSSELGISRFTVEMPELRRTTMTAVRSGSTGTDIFNSQNLLLDGLEDMSYKRSSTDHHV